MDYCKTDYEKGVMELVSRFGGFYNAHSHGDRAFTRKDEYYAYKGLSVSEIERLPLEEKQNLTWVLHTGPAFSEASLIERMTKLLKDSFYFGVTKLNSCIDVTYNTGLKSFKIARQLKEKFKGKVEFNLGVYNPSGFKDSAKKRFELFEEAANGADFLVALAEKDNKEGHIGEEQHNIYMLELGLKLNKPVHFHVGQANAPQDKGTELLFECMDWVYRLHHRLDKKDYPRNALIHDISSSCYPEEDFKKHCENLKNFSLEVICCPTAGISMRQKSEHICRIHNSLARIWDFAMLEIPVFIGTDNINDIFVPSSTPDLYDEVFTLTNSLRGYNELVLAKIASGKPLDSFDRGRIKRMIS